MHDAYLQSMAQDASFPRAMEAAAGALRAEPAGTLFSFSAPFALTVVALVRFVGLPSVAGLALVPVLGVSSVMLVLLPGLLEVARTPPDQLGDLALIGGARGMAVIAALCATLTCAGVAGACWLGDVAARLDAASRPGDVGAAS